MTNDPVELLYYASRALWLSANTGNPSISTARLRTRMRNPQPGDLVIEVSGLNHTFDPDSVGRLIRIEHPDDMDLTRWIVEPLHEPGREQGWRNAEFVAVPDQRSSDQWAAPEDETP